VHVVPLAVALAAYAVTPFQVGAAAFLNVRLAPVVFLLMLPLLKASLPRWFQAAVAAVSFAGGMVYAYSAHALYAEQGRPMLDVLSGIEPGTRVTTLNFVHGARNAYLDPYPYAGTIAAARSGGIPGFSFATLPHWSIHHKADTAPPSHVPFWIFAPCTFRNRIDGAYFDYVVVRGSLNPFQTKPEGPRFEPIRQAANYTLYRKVADEMWARADGAPADEGPCAQPTNAVGE
jgi:hypothetical protein